MAPYGSAIKASPSGQIMATPMIAPQISDLTLCISSNLSSAISTICWISSIIAGQSKYGVDDGISGACDEPPDNVDIDPHLRTQHR